MVKKVFELEFRACASLTALPRHAIPPFEPNLRLCIPLILI
jgi:hypothetical protein